MEVIPELVCRHQIAFYIVNRELAQTGVLMAEDFSSVVRLNIGRIGGIECLPGNNSVSTVV